MKRKKIKIELIHWHYTCGDGCCDDYGVSLKMNGEELEHPDSTDEQYISNNYMGDDVDTALRAVLKKLGYTNVEVITKHDDED